MKNPTWSVHDQSEFRKLIDSSDFTRYKTIEEVTAAFNSVAEIKRGNGAIAFKLRNWLDTSYFKGDRKDFVESLIYNFKRPPKMAKPVVKPSAPPSETPITPTEEWLTAAQLGKHFNYSTSWVELMARLGHIRRMRRAAKVCAKLNGTRYTRFAALWFYNAHDAARLVANPGTYSTDRKQLKTDNKPKLGRPAVIETQPIAPPSITHKKVSPPGDDIVSLVARGKLSVSGALELLRRL